VLFREFMGRYQPEDLLRKGKLWAVDFDPRDPARTPNTLAPGEQAMQNLALAAKLMQSRQLALDVPLGEVQYADKGGRRIPIHGGDGAYDGLLNMQRNARNGTTLEPMDNPPAVAGSRFLTEKGYPVATGSSFLMAMEFTADGPRAKAFLTYSQSGDPASPHFTDQTELFSRKQWRPILFSEQEIKGDVRRDYRVSARRDKLFP
jgi:acyl-homoserine-lactone acylase